MLYKLITLEVDDHDNSVNNAHYTGETLELPETPTTEQVCRELKKLGRMARHWKTANITLEENGDGYNVCQRNGKKVYCIEPVKTPTVS